MTGDTDRAVARLENAFLRSAAAGLVLQNRDGSFAAGHSGRHEHQHTPVRNTAHWLVSLATAWRDTRDPRFEAAANRAADFLLRPEWRPGGMAFFCRDRPGTDGSNGLIGQAWVLDALAHAGRSLQRPDCDLAAMEVFLAHPFDERAALWKILEPDGTSRGISTTFNQQLWFAVAGTAILDRRSDHEVERRVGRFIEGLGSHFRIDRSGFAFHTFRPFRSRSQRVVDALRAMRGRHPQQVGYHSFVLAGFARLEQSGRLGRATRLDRRLSRALQILVQRRYRDLLEGDPFAWSYNPTGFEVAFVLQVFRNEIRRGDVDDQICTWVEAQLDRHFDDSTGLMNRETRDPNVLPARMCEAVDLLDAMRNARPVPG